MCYNFTGQNSLENLLENTKLNHDSSSNADINRKFGLDVRNVFARQGM